MNLWVKENGKSEGFNVMLKIEIYISLERGQTSIRSYVTREFEEFLKGGKQMYEQSCAPTNQIRRWEDIDFVKAEYEVKKRRIFVSHRRIDGEEIAAKLCDKFLILEKSKSLFRDVVEVKVGESAQEVIDKALYESDAFIFLHTPKSVESDWIKKELKMATMYDVPVIWVRIDDASIEELSIIPGEKPHIECRSEDFEDGLKLELFVNDLEKMLMQTIMSHSLKLYDYKERFGDWANEKGIHFSCVDSTNQIYEIVYKEKVKKQYPRNDYIQYVQYYGRGIKEKDIEILKKGIEGKQYDSVVLLSNREKEARIEEKVFANSYDLHDIWWRRMVGEKMEHSGKKIVICGAFPECKEELYKIPLLEAVKIFSQEIIKNGYTLVFGAHPTFQKLIFEVASEFSDDSKEAVQVYVSKYFEGKYPISDMEKAACVHEIEAMADRNQSLTKMREAMLGADDVCAIICLGGKIKEDNPLECGLDEEIQIAQENKIPVFLVGSVGGRSS